MIPGLTKFIAYSVLHKFRERNTAGKPFTRRTHYLSTVVSRLRPRKTTDAGPSDCSSHYCPRRRTMSFAPPRTHREYTTSGILPAKIPALPHSRSIGSSTSGKHETPGGRSRKKMHEKSGTGWLQPTPPPKEGKETDAFPQPIHRHYLRRKELGRQKQKLGFFGSSPDYGSHFAQSLKPIRASKHRGRK